MFVPDRIAENLRFLIRAVQTQVARTRSYVVEGGVGIEGSMRSRDDYINNLRTFVQRASFEQAAETEEVAFPTAASTIATNLERIADFCLDVVDQLQHIDPSEGAAHPEFRACFDVVDRALAHVERAVEELDVHEALKVCRAEPRLDDIYAEAFQEHLAAMERGEPVHRNVTLLFVTHYFERMGDSLLNIGEAIISASLGEKIKIGQLWALQGSLSDVAPSRTVQDVELEVPGESRSGCRIAMVSDHEHTDATRVFKEGDLKKLSEERDAIAVWEERVPGIAPRVDSFLENGDHAAMLMEYLPGRTLEQVVLQGDARTLREALDRTTETLRRVWEATWTEEPARSDFVGQLRKRLPEVYATHRGFRRGESRIGGVSRPSMEVCLDRLEALEARCGVKFSVLIHGDFNTDNIILPFEGDGRGVRLIDLHRSRLGDYLQDASVFLVSNFRLQIFEAPVRRRIQDTMRWFLDFTREQAARWDDVHAEPRLGLGLVRSLITSTRFILDEGFARELHLRGEFVMDRLLRAQAPSDFQLPEELFRD
jgi:phosphate uptake regulator/aminoglycoside phosphotransferase (APT) family kinase protein